MDQALAMLFMALLFPVKFLGTDEYMYKGREVSLLILAGYLTLQRFAN